MTEEKLDLLWAEVVHVGKVERLEYDAMVALGSVFGQMKATILEQQKEIDEYKKLNRETNMEIGRHSQNVLNLAELNKALSKELESLANKMLNGDLPKY